MVKYNRFFFVGILFLLLFACSDEPSANKDSGDKISGVIDKLPSSGNSIEKTNTNSSTEPKLKELKVCADPYMLPFSNKDEEGYENKIAKLIAEKMGFDKVKYTFFPQRIGFIRNTLKAKNNDHTYKCDLVISVPDGFELAATTIPYYSTSYALVYVKGRKLDEINSAKELSDFVNNKGNRDIKIGISDKGPGQLWVFYNELMGNIVPYQGQSGNPEITPGQKLIKELIDGNIDATIAMGTSAGYFAKKYKNEVELVLLPLEDNPSIPNMKFKYNFSMAVRYADKKWKEELNKFITENQSEIEQILLEHGVLITK